MDQSALPPLPQARATPPGRPSTLRVITALVMREMSTTHGRSAMGYLWAILEPVAGIMLMSLIFSLGFRSPGIGTNFALFFASGILPFMTYSTTNITIASAIRFNRALLFYPGVTYIDALVARLIMNTMTQVFVAALVFTGVIWIYDVDVIIDLPAIIFGFAMAVALGTGLGTLNCFLMSMFPVWERAWAVMNRPMFIISCVIFLYDTVPMPYRDWLWWNPVVHIVGQVRSGIYATYDATYVSPLYVFSIAAGTLTLGLLLLRRYHRDILND